MALDWDRVFNGGMTNPAFVPTITLNDGTVKPAIGFGTWKLRGDEAYRAVRSAIEVGYRHIDTAFLYKNEEEVGRAVRDAVSAGDTTREELFITSKVWHTDHGFEETQAAFDRSLKTMGLDYLDCYMVHWPWPKAGLFVDSFRALARVQGLGKLQSVAVANFNPEHLDAISEATGINPVLNQVEMHVGFSQPELRAYHEKHGIVGEAWSPLGQGDLLTRPEIVAIAEECGVSPAQVALRFLVQLGCSAVPKSAHRERQAANLDIFNFELSNEQMDTLLALDNSEIGGRLYADPLTFPE